MERWAKVPGLDRYEVSTHGRVRSLKYKGKSKPRIMKQKTRSQGYREIGLYDKPKSRGGRQAHYLVHKLVLMAFVRAPEQGEVCRHLDGNPANNRLENLAWGTQSENWMDARRHGTEVRCKLTDDDVRAIRSEFVAGRNGNARQLAERFGVHMRTVWLAATGRSYAWVT